MRTISLALIGLGTVGTGVARLLLEESAFLERQCQARLVLKTVVVRDKSKPREVELPGVHVTDDLRSVLEDPEIEISAELVGGVRTGGDILAQLLSAGKHVVTANKAALAERGRELFALAHRVDRTISFEAAVGGGIPIIHAIAESLAGNRLTSILSILNGTSNFILSAMHEQGWDFETALRRAQELGFAEADPTLDVRGNDAAQKLAILARLAFHAQVDADRISTRGIDELTPLDVRFATELGYVLKLLALGKMHEGSLHLRVAPTLVRRSHPLARVSGEWNACEVVGEAVGETFFAGKGAGRMPTASSVLAGILDLAIGRAQRTFTALRLWETNENGPAFMETSDLPSRFYLRFMISDRPGTLGCIAGILGEEGISIASVIQPETDEGQEGSPVPLIMMTHEANEAAVRRALRRTDALDIVRQSTMFLHVASP